MLIPLGAAALALAVALSAYVMVKFYGVIFLGQPREPSLVSARDANWLERLGLIWLAAGCILVGALPQLVLRAIAPVTAKLLGDTVKSSSTFWSIAPIAQEQASYSGLILLAGILSVVAVTFVCVRLLAHGRIRRTDAWDCGYPWQTSRMQDTAEGFGQPIRHLFGTFFRMERDMPSASDTAPRYRIYIEDRLWRSVYLPIARGVQKLSDAIGFLQGGRLSIYLLYSFLTLLALLVFVL
jgi:hypothetical protein